MKNINLKTTTLCCTLLLSANVFADWTDLFKQSNDAAETIQNTTATVNTINNTVQNKQAITDAVQSGLTNRLVQELGVTSTQAQGGAGALFQIAKSKMAGNDFNQLSQAIPGMDQMLSAVPQASASNNLLGSLAAASGNSTLANAASLVNTFQKLNLSKDMVGQFTPIVIDYVKKNSGNQLANLLQAAFTGS